MKIDMSGVIYSLSYALDCIEGELVGVTHNHARWVAYLATLIGRKCGLNDDELADLAACAALHDNALTQYLSEEQSSDGEDMFGTHCILGEENISKFPFHGDTTGFILYHHENADGSGPFGKTTYEMPLEAHIIHLADILDVACNLQDVSLDNYRRMEVFVKQQRNKMFDESLVDAFFDALPCEKYLSIKGEPIEKLLKEEVPHRVEEHDFADVQHVIDTFGKIVDYKSPFTRHHSEHVAEKINIMCELYGYSQEKSERLYVAAVLHDIGKMAISNKVLEKPDKLTDTEFAFMQNHAWYTYVILKQIEDFKDITQWAALHHEKLNGKGYPFGKCEDELSKEDRLMACIDIYQALTEDRPYKKGMPHERCIEIMRDMAEKHLIDGEITEDIAAAFEKLSQNA